MSKYMKDEVTEVSASQIYASQKLPVVLKFSTHQFPTVPRSGMFSPTNERCLGGPPTLCLCASQVLMQVSVSVHCILMNIFFTNLSLTVHVEWNIKLSVVHVTFTNLKHKHTDTLFIYSIEHTNGRVQSPVWTLHNSVVYTETVEK